jgi:hypothetical protein
MLVLVTAAHMRETALAECFVRHRGRIMVPGEKITALVREPLPALEPERLGPQIQRAAMNEEHSFVSPFHRHCIKYREERGIAELLVPVGTCRIAPADKDTMKIGMIMVTQHRDETEFPRQGMDLLKRFLGTVPPVEEIPEVYQGIHGPEFLLKRW